MAFPCISYERGCLIPVSKIPNGDDQKTFMTLWVVGFSFLAILQERKTKKHSIVGLEWGGPKN